VFGDELNQIFLYSKNGMILKVNE
jgi:hypothetical protein